MQIIKRQKTIKIQTLSPNFSCIKSLILPTEYTEILDSLFHLQLLKHCLLPAVFTNSAISLLPRSRGTCGSDLCGHKSFLETCTAYLISITYPCWICSSLPTEPTGQWRTLLTWACTLSYSSLTACEPMPGGLWTSALGLIPSSQSCYKPSPPS